MKVNKLQNLLRALSTNEKLDGFDETVKSEDKLKDIHRQTFIIAQLLETIIETIKESGIPLELTGLEKVIIESDPNLAREGNESNKLLKELIKEINQPAEIDISLELE